MFQGLDGADMDEPEEFADTFMNVILAEVHISFTTRLAPMGEGETMRPDIQPYDATTGRLPDIEDLVYEARNFGNLLQSQAQGGYQSA